MKTTLEKVSRKGSQISLYLVKQGDQILGLLEKYPNTRTETHPWKAFKGYGEKVELIGFFYEDSRYATDGAKAGGRKAAIAAIENAAK